MAYHAVHTLALQFTGSVMPPDVHLTPSYIGVLPGPPPCSLIKGLGTRLYCKQSKTGVSLIPKFLCVSLSLPPHKSLGTRLRLVSHLQYKAGHMQIWNTKLASHPHLPFTLLSRFSGKLEMLSGRLLEILSGRLLVMLLSGRLLEILSG